MSYFNYVKDILYPFIGPPPGATDDDRRRVREYNQAQRALAREKIGQFTHPGHPGHVFAGVHARLHAVLRLAPEEAAAVQHVGVPHLASGYRHVVPGYFRLMRHLVEEGRRFLVCFRTFGSDHVEVALEHNLWATGKHPLYPNPYSHITSPLQVHFPHDTGSFKRAGTHSRDTFLSAVTHVRGAGMPPLASTVVGYRDVYDWLSARVPEAHHGPPVTPTCFGRAACLRDDWEWWFSNKELGAYGKILPVDPDDDTAASIFFDDNVGDAADAIRILSDECLRDLQGDGVRFEPTLAPGDDLEKCIPPPTDYDDAGIVDVRHVHTSEPLSYGATRHAFIARVDPVSVILNENYFVQLLELCERNITERRAAGRFRRK